MVCFQTTGIKPSACMLLKAVCSLPKAVFVAEGRCSLPKGEVRQVTFSRRALRPVVSLKTVAAFGLLYVLTTMPRRAA